VISEQAGQSSPAASAQAAPWWRGAVIYEIYPRSFADGSGDGTGDLAGVRARLPYLRDLGVDAVWFTPWYPSPMADGGYDVTDYRSIDPGFGDLREAELLIAEARGLGIRTIVDVVPNHVSDQHPWFHEALGSPAGSAQRGRTEGCRRTRGSPSSAARPGPGPPIRTARRASGTCTCSPRASLT
jgi:alpha-glucosidase